MKCTAKRWHWALALLLAAALAACGVVNSGNNEDYENNYENYANEENYDDYENNDDDEDEEGVSGIALEGTGGAVDLCGGHVPAWVTDLGVYQAPESDEPALLEPYLDPMFDTCVLRVTDAASQRTGGDPSTGMKNEYSRVQAFNADESLILVRSIEAFWYVYDAVSLQPLGQVAAVDEPRWDAEDPYRLYFIDETRLLAVQVDSGAVEVVRDFADDLPMDVVMVWTRYEGSPSADTRYWGLIAQDEEWLAAAFLVYDREADEVIAVRDLRSYPVEMREYDSVTISLLGNYFLAFSDLYCDYGQLGSDDAPCGLMVYDRDLSNGRSLLRLVGHSDVALDAAGREVLVYQDIDTDQISMLDLESGQITPLFDIDFSHSPIGFHFSGQAVDMPGWVVISTYSGGYPEQYTWMDNQVFAVELRAGGRVVRLAHAHSIVDEEQEHDYWAEPQATVNRDLTRILFTSNWGHSGTPEVEMYMIVLPEGWLDLLP